MTQSKNENLLKRTPPMGNDPFQDEIASFVDNARKKANIGSKAWSTAYHAAFGIAGVLGIIVGTLSQSSFASCLGFSKDTIITVLSVFAALLTFVGGFGGFERKWRSNRIFRSELDQIRIDLKDPNKDITQIREAVRKSSMRHNQAIVTSEE